MMSNKILVTDSLFIFDEHIQKLRSAGYEVERLDKPRATEAELCDAVKGKVAYILGGIETVTDKVVEAADELKAIAFTGSDWQALITGWEKATQKGIAITNAPGGNSDAVAEYAVTLALAMQRNIFELGRTGEKTFETTRSVNGTTVGVLGSGHIGSKIINSVKSFGPSRVLYYSRTKKDNGAEYTSFEVLIKESDIIFVAVPGSAGQMIDKNAIKSIKENSLIVSISPKNVIDMEALLGRLKAKTLRAAIDWPAPSEDFAKLPLSVWFNSNDHAAYNTDQALTKCSDMAIDSLINVLKTGQDQHRVN